MKIISVALLLLGLLSNVNAACEPKFIKASEKFIINLCYVQTISKTKSGIYVHLIYANVPLTEPDASRVMSEFLKYTRKANMYETSTTRSNTNR